MFLSLSEVCLLEQLWVSHSNLTRRELIMRTMHCKRDWNYYMSCFHLLFPTADDDYVPGTIEVQFQIAPDTMCHSFTILEDTEVEPVETFGVLLETSDPAVQLTDIFATVSINDSTGISPVQYRTVHAVKLLTDNSSTPSQDD